MKRFVTLFVIFGLVVASGSMAEAKKKKKKNRHRGEQTVDGSYDAPAPQWAPASEATIHPGVQTLTGELQCTANFVFYDANSIYLGQAAHCSGSFSTENYAGCRQSVLPLGTRVDIQGASQPGTIVYNSFLTMQRVGEQDETACEGNDFALVRLHSDDETKVNPSLPFWGGPTSSSGGTTSFGDRVYSYGNSWLRAGVPALMPKYGINSGKEHYAVGDATGWGPEEHEWTHYIHTVTPGIFGDSGSPVLDAGGRALGILSTISLDGSTGIADFSKAIRYMRANTNLDAVQLAQGTTSFLPPP